MNNFVVIAFFVQVLVFCLIVTVSSEDVVSGDGKSRLRTRIVPKDGLLLDLIVGEFLELNRECCMIMYNKFNRLFFE